MWQEKANIRPARARRCYNMLSVVDVCTADTALVRSVEDLLMRRRALGYAARAGEDLRGDRASVAGLAGERRRRFNHGSLLKA